MGLMRRHALLTCNEAVLSLTLTVSTKFGRLKYLPYLCIVMKIINIYLLSLLSSYSLTIAGRSHIL